MPQGIARPQLAQSDNRGKGFASPVQTRWEDKRDDRKGRGQRPRATQWEKMCQYKTGQPTCHGAENKVGLGDLSWAAQETSTPWQCAREPKSAATQYNAILGQSCQQAACQRQARGIACEESKTCVIPEVLATTRVELPNIIGFVSVHDQQLPVIGADPVCADIVCAKPIL